MSCKRIIIRLGYANGEIRHSRYVSLSGLIKSDSSPNVANPVLSARLLSVTVMKFSLSPKC